MKLLSNYTQEELASITPDQKQELFLLECASRGIPLPAAIPAYMESPAEREDMQPDIVVYRVVSDYGSAFYFSTLEQAKSVAELITSTGVGVDYNYSDSSKRYYVKQKQTESIDVSPVNAYSIDKYNELKGELKLYDERKKIIDANNAWRNALLEQHEELMSEIENVIADAVKNITRLGELADMFKQYLTMADNNHDVAVRFLLNAHYDEVSKYDPEQLEKIGLSAIELDDYIKASAKEEEE